MQHRRYRGTVHAFARDGAAMTDQEHSLTALRNLGPASVAMLVKAGITSAAQLRQLGAVDAFLRVRAAGGKPSLNLLWALHGALHDCDWKTVAQQERLALLLELEEKQR